MSSHGVDEGRRKLIDRGEFVVKVQLPIEPPDGDVLIYDEPRDVLLQFPLDDEIRSVMHGELKAYFVARVKPDGLLELLREAPAQSW